MRSYCCTNEEVKLLLHLRRHEFEVGKEVEIKEGPFAGFVGIIDYIDEENEKLDCYGKYFW